MFNNVSIPTIAVVENMSTFRCSCGKETAIFDEPGRTRKIAEKFGVPTLIQLPIDPKVSGRGSSVEPFVLDPIRRERLLATRIGELADAVKQELVVLRSGSTRRNLRTLDGVNGQSLIEMINVSGSGVKERRLIDARTARLACRSAAMWDEWTGEKLFNEEDIPSDVRPTKIEAHGTYAAQIDWSDGHTSLMSFKALEEISVQTN